MRYQAALHSEELFIAQLPTFSTKELAINYAKKKKIDFEILEQKKRKVVKKSYADNFLN